MSQIVSGNRPFISCNSAIIHCFITLRFSNCTALNLILIPSIKHLILPGITEVDQVIPTEGENAMDSENETPMEDLTYDPCHLILVNLFTKPCLLLLTH